MHDAGGILAGIGLVLPAHTLPDLLRTCVIPLHGTSQTNLLWSVHQDDLIHFVVKATLVKYGALQCHQAGCLPLTPLAEILAYGRMYNRFHGCRMLR